MRIGIIGLPNVGKSTLFKVLTSQNVDIADYPFTTIDPNIGFSPLIDDNLTKLSKFFNSKKISYAKLKFVDIAGLVKGAHKGEGLGNQFLAHIREMDLLIHLIGCFKKDFLDIENSYQVVNLELIFKDIETIEKKISEINLKLKSVKNNQLLKEKQILEKALSILSKERLLIEENLSKEEINFLTPLNLLTLKPQILLINLSEEDFVNKNFKKINSNFPQLNICVELEEELSELPEEERKEFLIEYGLTEQLSQKLLKMCFKILDLIVFYTANKNEAKAWITKKNTTLLEAAEKIHTDFKEKFICAEVININELLKFPNYQEAKEKGKIKIKGRDELVNHQDVILIKI